MPNAPKSQYKFTPYLYGPRAKRTYLDDGGGAFGNNLDELMLDRGAPDTAPLQVEDYQGALPDHLRDRRLFSELEPPRSFSGPGSHLLLAGEAVPGIPPDLHSQDWRGKPTPSAAPSEAHAEPPAGLPSDMADLKDVSRREIEHLKNYPTMQKPKWWQSALGGAAGFGAGWSNAASRTKHPIDIGAMSENILHPGYADEVARWRSEHSPLQAEAEIQGGLQNARLKQEQIDSQRTQREATADWRKHQADPHYGKIPVPPEIGKEYTMPEKDGTYWMDKTDLAAHIRNQKESPDRQVVVNNPDVAELLGIKPGESYDRELVKSALSAATRPDKSPSWAQIEMDAANGDAKAQKVLADREARRIAFHKTIQQGKPAGGGLKPGQFESIERDHQNSYDRLEADYSRDLAAAYRNPDPVVQKQLIQGAKDSMERRKSQIENAYQAKIGALTGNYAGVHAMPAPTPVGGQQQAPPPSPPQQRGPQGFAAGNAGLPTGGGELQGSTPPAPKPAPRPSAPGPATRQGGTNRAIKTSPTSILLPDGRRVTFKNEATTNQFLDLEAKSAPK